MGSAPEGAELPKGSAELAGNLDGKGYTGTGWGHAAKQREAACSLPCQSAMDVPQLIPATWDLLAWTWGTSGLWDTRLRLHSRARLIAGDATLLPTAHSRCNDFLAAKLNCLSKLSAAPKEKWSKSINRIFY